MKQDEFDDDLEFITIIGLGGKSASYWKINRKQSWKWKGVCKAYRNPISKYDVGQMSSNNRGKTWRAHVVFTTRGGMVWNMEKGSSEKAQLQTTISMKIDVVKYSPK
jgi:hypothetical protein